MAKRLWIVTSLFITVLWSYADSPSFSVNIGGDFFNYQESFLNTGLAYMHPLADGMEVFIGANFAINAAKDQNSVVTPNFYFPLNLGLNFTFPQGSLIYLLGTGLNTTFKIDTVQDSSYFYMGPYLKAGLRVAIHELMNWFLELDQDLIIGQPLWINFSTRLTTGINFRFKPR